MAQRIIHAPETVQVVSHEAKPVDTGLHSDGVEASQVPIVLRHT